MNLYKVCSENEKFGYVGANSPSDAIEMFRSHHKMKATDFCYIGGRIKDANIKEGVVAAKAAVERIARDFGDRVPGSDV